MFGRGKSKLIDKKSGRNPGSVPWNKGLKYKTEKGHIIKMKKINTT